MTTGPTGPNIHKETPMGTKYETHAWVDRGNTAYSFEVVYQGRSLIKAVVAAIRAKRTAGMVKVEWR